jgi:hypothetical protein
MCLTRDSTMKDEDAIFQFVFLSNTKMLLIKASLIRENFVIAGQRLMRTAWTQTTLSRMGISPLDLQYVNAFVYRNTYLHS